MTANAEIFWKNTRLCCRFRRRDLYDKDKKASVEIPDSRQDARIRFVTLGFSNGRETKVLSGLKEAIR